jgi:hypothetical protein
MYIMRFYESELEVVFLVSSFLISASYVVILFLIIIRDLYLYATKNKNYKEVWNYEEVKI